MPENIRKINARRQSDCLDIEFSVDKYRFGSDGVFNNPTRLARDAGQKSPDFGRGVIVHERGSP